MEYKADDSECVCSEVETDAGNMEYAEGVSLFYYSQTFNNAKLWRVEAQSQVDARGDVPYALLIGMQLLSNRSNSSNARIFFTIVIVCVTCNAITKSQGLELSCIVMETDTCSQLITLSIYVQYYNISNSLFNDSLLISCLYKIALTIGNELHLVK